MSVRGHSIESIRLEAFLCVGFEGAVGIIDHAPNYTTSRNGTMDAPACFPLGVRQRSGLHQREDEAME